MKVRFAAVFLLLFVAAAVARAEVLTGTVSNATTGKPSSGDEVVLLSLSQGMNEAGRTKSDAQGRFSFDITDASVPHLVRVNHQGVSYFPAGGPIAPGATSVEIKVYDAAKKLDGITTNVSIMRVQSDGSSLQVLQLTAVQNQSTPPRALMADRTFEFYLPSGAVVDQALAQSPGGMPVNTAPVPDEKTKDKYYLAFPLRPGETRFEVAYHLPYSGEAVINPKFVGGLQHFVVVTPKSMQFRPKEQARFSPMNDEVANSTIMVATAVKAGQDLSFRVSGTGILQEEQQAASAGQPTQAPDNRPGGGLGRPIDTPDPLYSYRWGVLGAMAAVLVVGGVYVMSRGSNRATTPNTAMMSEEPAVANTAASRSTVLLEALKEELFQLELERQQGRISPQQYEKARAALGETLQRALSRRKQPQA